MGKSYIRTKGARLAVSLLDHLKQIGVKAGPVSEPAKRTMTVWYEPGQDQSLIPDEWDGNRVVKIAGQPDYQNMVDE